MNVASFYRLNTGEFTGRVVYTSTELAPVADDACPPGCAWIAGKHDRETHRVDTATGEVVAKEKPCG